MSLRSGIHIYWLAVAGLACALVWPPATAAIGSAGDPRAEAAAPPQGVVLLQNGRVLRGTAVRDGDEYVVRLRGGELRVPHHDVHLVCESLDEAYALQSRRLSGRNPDEHLALARWCLSYGLKDYARREVKAALAIDPDHRRARVMLKRIATLSDTISPEPPKPEKSSELPHSFKRPSPEPQDEQSPAAVDSLPPDLPRLARRAFVVAIQPVLLDSCGQSGCHGRRADNPLRLELPGRSRQDERDAGEANFRAVLEYVDLHKPAESPLLLAPMRKHGRSSRAIFSGPDDPGYRKLSAWVFAISSQPDSAPAAAAPPEAPKPTPIEDLPPEVRQQIQQFTVPPIGVDQEDRDKQPDPYEPKTSDQEFLKQLIKALGLGKK